ncbi:MAG: hypothetical protein JNK02_03520 [Planctomycetes bacterium]|nr:hypothetical protein [Planctomycetota bacterium]
MLTLAACALCSSSALTQGLVLTPHAQLDISGHGLSGVGDLAFELPLGRLWIAPWGTFGPIVEVNASTGALLSSVDPSAISPTSGVTALAIPFGITSPHLFGFTVNGHGGRITQSGVLVTNLGSGHFGTTGADFDPAGNLWTTHGSTSGGGTTLRRIDTSTGAVLQSVVVQGTTLRARDLAFDPTSGRCYVWFEGANHLVEVNLTTGAQVSTTLIPGLQGGGTSGGLDFSGNGELLYAAEAPGPELVDVVHVFRRDFDETICDGSGSGATCPCGNAGLVGRGCENSFATGGALLDTTGFPDVSTDTLTLVCSGMPPNTSCLFFQGTTTPESLPTPFGDGLRCVTGIVTRLGTKSTTAGAASYPAAGDVSVSVRGGIPAVGATRFYQAWYRNAAPFCTPSGFNLSNGLRVRWHP